MKAGWQLKRLGDLVTLNYGKALDKSQRSLAGPVPTYGANGIKDYTERFDYTGPTLIVGRKGSAGAITRVDNQFWPLDVTYYTTHNEDLITFDYLEYLLNSLNLPSLAKGVKPGINRDDVYRLNTTLPPIEEQRRIVAILDKAFAGLETARANAEANLKNAEVLQKSHLISVLHSASDSWQSSDLSTLALNLDAKRVPITKKDRVAGEFPYYGASGIVDYVDGFIFDDDLLLVSEDGANLLARTYPIAFRVSGKCWVNNHAHVLKFEDQRIAHYVELYLNSISVEPWVSGMAQPKLNQRALNSISIPLPSNDLLEHILSRHSDLSANVNSLEQHYIQSSVDIEHLRQSLLQKAFAGELT